MPRLFRRAAAAPLLLLAFEACLPYTVGSTARTMPVGETSRATSWYFIPNAVKLPGDSITGPLAGTDFELRHGIDAKSDFGLRVMPTGVAADYKRRIAGDGGPTQSAVAYVVGGGIVNGGLHAMVTATVMASGREDAAAAPYGGVRAIQVFPISAGAVTDRPTIGAFAGVQLGDADFTIRPELGVFYDRSALGVRRGDVILVPAVTLQRGRRRDHRAAPRPMPVRLPARPGDPRPSPLVPTVPPPGAPALPPPTARWPRPA